MANLAYLSLGSNVGDRAKNLRAAISSLQGFGRVAAVSSFYETEPVELTDQDWFVNCAVALQTELGSLELLSEILKIERDMGRRRAVKKGPRIIDIDILLFGNEVQSSPELVIPHPGMTQRRFVLQPLAEIAPDARHPLLNETIQELLNELPSGQIVRKL